MEESCQFCVSDCFLPRNRASKPYNKGVASPLDCVSVMHHLRTKFIDINRKSENNIRYVTVCFI
jgi:hypothetical protein